MENSNFFLGRKNDKATKLHHELQINLFKEDCKNFDNFLGLYCFVSIVHKIIFYSLEYNNLDFSGELAKTIQTIICDTLGLIVWTGGLMISIKSLRSYTIMKSKAIRSCAKKLLLFLVFLIIYFMFCLVIIVLSLYNGKQEEFSTIDSNEKILIVTLLLLLILSTIFASLYFYSQKIGLAEEIQKYDSRSAKENAAYRKPGASFDI